MPRGIKAENSGSGSTPGMKKLTVVLSDEDLKFLEDYAAKQFRTPAGQASFILNEMISRHRTQNMIKGSPASLGNPVSTSTLFEREGMDGNVSPLGGRNGR